MTIDPYIQGHPKSWFHMAHFFTFRLTLFCSLSVKSECQKIIFDIYSFKSLDICQKWKTKFLRQIAKMGLIEMVFVSFGEHNIQEPYWNIIFSYFWMVSIHPVIIDKIFYFKTNQHFKRDIYVFLPVRQFCYEEKYKKISPFSEYNFDYFSK